MDFNTMRWIIMPSWLRKRWISTRWDELSRQVDLIVRWKIAADMHNQPRLLYFYNLILRISSKQKGRGRRSWRKERWNKYNLDVIHSIYGGWYLLNSNVWLVLLKICDSLWWCDSLWSIVKIAVPMCDGAIDNGCYKDRKVWWCSWFTTFSSEHR